MTRPEKPEAAAAARKRDGRLTTQGKRIDGGGWCSLQLTHEADGSWTVHGPIPVLGVQLEAADMVALAEAICERAR